MSLEIPCPNAHNIQITIPAPSTFIPMFTQSIFFITSIVMSPFIYL